MLISLADIKTYLWNPSMTDAEATLLYNQSYAILCGLCNVESFDDIVTTDRFDFIWSWPYYLTRYSRNNLVSINGTSVSYTEGIEYIARWRRIEFSSNILLSAKNTEFNYIEITYNSGFVTAPSDLSSALFALITYSNTANKAWGMKSYSQGDLSIEYLWSSNDISKDSLNLISKVVGKYWFIDIYSV
jgi:hypothetical protein